MVSQTKTKKVSTGSTGLDMLLQGGIPEGSVVLIAGESGTGKSILAIQWLFDGVKNGENGVYISITEPLFKMVRNLETMEFYNKEAVEDEKLVILDTKRFIDATEKEFQQKLIKIIEKEVKRIDAKRLVMDSITAICYRLEEKSKIREFIFDLGTTLAALGCTTFLTSEVPAGSGHSIYGVEEFIADGIIKLMINKFDHQSFRYLNIVKMRGTDFIAQHTSFSITNKGIQVYPDITTSLALTPSYEERISCGVPELDSELQGGFYKGSSTLVTGATGVGKSVFSMHFINEGLRQGEKCLLCSFEEPADQIVRNAESLGFDWKNHRKKGSLVIRALYPSEQSPEQHLYEIKDIVEKHGIKRCIIDGVSTFSHHYNEPSVQYFIKRLNSELKSSSVSFLFTAATAGFISGSELMEARLATITDNIVILRYVEVSGDIKTIVDILKVRGSQHATELREYKIEPKKGIVLGYPLKGYEGILTGTTRKVDISIIEKLRNAFVDFLGPAGENEISNLLKKGTRKKEGILGYADTLLEKHFITKEQHEKFKVRIEEIFEGL